MAVPTSFSKENCILDKPDTMTSEECAALNVCMGTVGDMPVVISCWKVTKEELEEINRTARIWILVLGTQMMPLQVMGHEPNWSE